VSAEENIDRDAKVCSDCFGRVLRMLEMLSISMSSPLELSKDEGRTVTMLIYHCDSV